MTVTPPHVDPPINPFTATLLWLWVFPLIIGLILLLVSASGTINYQVGNGEGQLIWGSVFTGLGFTTLLVWLAVKGILWARSSSAAA